MEDMELTLTTPAVLFPALSLLLLAFTNRFLGLASLIRSLHGQYRNEPQPILKAQIENLRKRVVLIRNMQALGTASMLSCVLCMLLLFAGFIAAAKAIFVLSLLLLIGSMALSLLEINISVNALHLQLKDLNPENQPPAP